MPRKLAHGPLTDRGAKAKKESGYYADGGNLYLQVSRSGTKSWIFRYSIGRKTTDMGLGSFKTFDLADARKRARACRQLLADGVDPRRSRNQVKQAEKLKQASLKTFEECATAYIKAHRNEWTNARHASQWSATLEQYAYPAFGGMSVADIATSDVLRALEPIWESRNVTATRLRARIEQVLDWAKVHGYRAGENPARWESHLKQTLSKPSKVHTVKHHEALDYRQMGEFMQELRKRPELAARALELCILTATRTQQVLNARWEEVDLDEGVFTVPEIRMKMKGRGDHRIPLSKPAITLLKGLSRTGDYIFPGRREGDPMDSNAMLQLLKDMERDVTVHGFRSSFRDWAREQTNYPDHVAEQALAHAIGGKVEQAYARGELFDKGARLTAEWATFCSKVQPKETSKVTPMRKKSS